MTVTDGQTIDEQAVIAFAEKVGADQAVAYGSALAYLGDRLGLWAALAEAGPVTSDELAERTGLAERYLREWLATQTAAGYLDHADGRFTLSRGAGRGARGGGVAGGLAAGFEVAAAIWAGTERLAEPSAPARHLVGRAGPTPGRRGRPELPRDLLNSLVDQWLPRRRPGRRPRAPGHGCSTSAAARAAPRC